MCGCSESKNGLLSSISMFLIKWPVSVSTLLSMQLYNQLQKMHLCDILPSRAESGFATCGVIETYAPSDLPEVQRRKCKMRFFLLSIFTSAFNDDL